MLRLTNLLQDLQSLVDQRAAGRRVEAVRLVALQLIEAGIDRLSSSGRFSKKRRQSQ